MSNTNHGVQPPGYRVGANPNIMRYIVLLLYMATPGFSLHWTSRRVVSILNMPGVGSEFCSRVVIIDVHRRKNLENGCTYLERHRNIYLVRTVLFDKLKQMKALVFLPKLIKVEKERKSEVVYNFNYILNSNYILDPNTVYKF